MSKPSTIKEGESMCHTPKPDIEIETDALTKTWANWGADFLTKET